MERRLWTLEEDQIIINLVNEHGRKKWTLIADQMHKKNSINYRTSKQIRERWHNHLDPQVNKQPWTSEEQTLLFQAHKKFGNRWKQIAAQLVRRTDNYVKNHFYSTLRRSLRRINKYLGFKNSTNQMRSIRPSILSYLLDLSDNDPECRILVSRIFQFSRFKPSKSSSCQLIGDSDKNKYQSAITKLLQINDTYTQHRNRKKGKNQIKVYKTTHSFKSKDQVEIQQKNELSTQKNPQEVDYHENDDEEFMDESWQKQTPLNEHYKFLPEIEGPEYECELLDKKMEDDNFGIIDEQSQFKAIQAISLFHT